VSYLPRQQPWLATPSSRIFSGNLTRVSSLVYRLSKVSLSVICASVRVFHSFLFITIIYVRVYCLATHTVLDDITTQLCDIITSWYNIATQLNCFVWHHCSCLTSHYVYYIVRIKLSYQQSYGEKVEFCMFPSLRPLLYITEGTAGFCS